MEDIKYIGEHLLPGQIGRFLIFVSFSFSLVAFISYLIASIKEKKGDTDVSWRNVARVSFFIHGAAVLGIMLCLFYIISHHYFEYQYAWHYSNRGLATKYLFSSFWTGQEGSFLLWTIWHVVLGSILIFTSGKWERPVLTVFSITQVFLASMLLGTYILGYKVGSNPFILLREAMQAPIFSRADYMTFVTDGNGLNPLLQNYWMVIHPPTLFMGFASTIIPFAFVMASLWRRDYTGWIKPAMPWVLYSSMILGVGILMGGAWAYEALSFGGFWAWDPVENASLVPWLTLVAGLHVLVAYRHSKHGLTATYILFITTFLLVLYSTFLTRSGILGNTSVHSFTDLGMSGQLIVFMMFYVVVSIAFLAWRWKEIPTPEKEEELSSREFWMFVGALVFTISSIMIVIYTSLPIYNKLNEALRGIKSLAPFITDKQLTLKDPIPTYNGFQVYIAILVGLLSGGVQFMRYKSSPWGKFFTSIAISLVLAAVLTAIAAYGLTITPIPYIAMLFGAFFAITANLSYIIQVLKGKILVSGGSVAHVGFGMMLLGILIANYKQTVISLNTTGQPFGEGFDEKGRRENIMLRLNESVKMGDYWVTYLGDSTSGPKTFYAVNYVRLGDNKKDTLEQFTLYPDILQDPKMGASPNPDTRHYLLKDVYTHVSSVFPEPGKPDEAPKDSFATQTVGVGDTFYIAKGFVVVGRPDTKPVIAADKLQPGDIPVGLNLDIQTLDGAAYHTEPSFIIRNRSIVMNPSEVKEVGAKFRLENLDPEKGKFTIGVSQMNPDDHFIIMKAIIFPYIKLLWIGVFVMVAGFLLSISRRIKDGKRQHAIQEA